MKQAMKILLATVVSLAIANCATYRMSEQAQTAITAGPHGILSVKLPNGKSIDGYDDKWKLEVLVNGERYVKDNFADDETYNIPVKTGEHDVLIFVQRSVLRPFRISYQYDYANFIPQKLRFDEGKTTSVTFEIPEKSVGVGFVVLGIVLPIIPIISWPAGAWPTKYADMKITTTVAQAAGNQPGTLKKKSK